MNETWEGKLYSEIVTILSQNGVRESERKLWIAKTILRAATRIIVDDVKYSREKCAVSENLTKEDYAELYMQMLAQYKAMRDDYFRLYTERRKYGNKEVLADMYELLEQEEGNTITVSCEDIESIAKRYGISKEELI